MSDYLIKFGFLLQSSLPDYGSRRIRISGGITFCQGSDDCTCQYWTTTSNTVSLTRSCHRCILLSNTVIETRANRQTNAYLAPSTRHQYGLTPVQLRLITPDLIHINVFLCVCPKPTVDNRILYHEDTSTHTQPHWHRYTYKSGNSDTILSMVPRQNYPRGLVWRDQLLYCYDNEQPHCWKRMLNMMILTPDTCRHTYLKVDAIWAKAYAAKSRKLWVRLERTRPFTTCL